MIYSLLCAATAILHAACSSQLRPEQVALDFIESCEQAAADHSPAQLRSLISDNYADDAGRTARDIKAIVSGYMLRNRSIHVFSRLHGAVENNGIIQATIISAFAALPINDLSALPTVNADIYWFDIQLSEDDGHWRLVRASWHPAMLEDFMKEP